MPKLNKTYVNQPYKNYIQPKVNKKLKLIQSSKKLVPVAPDTVVSSIVTNNFSLLKRSLKSPRDYLDYVWYAAYDEDILSETFFARLAELKDGSYPLRVKSAVVPGYQLCFDQALSDYPYVRVFQEMSPMSAKQGKEPPMDFVYVKLYLLKRDQLIELLKVKALDG
jgi:hypothetical protein